MIVACRAHSVRFSVLTRFKTANRREPRDKTVFWRIILIIFYNSKTYNNIEKIKLTSLREKVYERTTYVYN